jgi:hypothetical protein
MCYHVQQHGKVSREIITAWELKPKVVTYGVRQDFNDCKSDHKLTSVQINISGRSHHVRLPLRREKRDALDLDSLRRCEDVSDNFNEYINAVLLKATEHDELIQHIEDGGDGDSILRESAMRKVQPSHQLSRPSILNY